ncbi:MAG: hypothetical protein GF364_21975 [Candidatus Lokiarchaeota archaeon]|nr:hypothetical protein [Candidatus Lokiarchaeota archaeon]
MEHIYSKGDNLLDVERTYLIKKVVIVLRKIYRMRCMFVVIIISIIATLPPASPVENASEIKQTEISTTEEWHEEIGFRDNNFGFSFFDKDGNTYIIGEEYSGSSQLVFFSKYLKNGNLDFDVSAVDYTNNSFEQAIQFEDGTTVISTFSWTGTETNVTKLFGYDIDGEYVFEKTIYASDEIRPIHLYKIGHEYFGIVLETFNTMTAHNEISIKIYAIDGTEQNTYDFTDSQADVTFEDLVVIPGYRFMVGIKYEPETGFSYIEFELYDVLQSAVQAAVTAMATGDDIDCVGMVTNQMDKIFVSIEEIIGSKTTASLRSIVIGQDSWYNQYTMENTGYQYSVEDMEITPYDYLLWVVSEDSTFGKEIYWCRFNTNSFTQYSIGSTSELTKDGDVNYLASDIYYNDSAAVLYYYNVSGQLNARVSFLNDYDESTWHRVIFSGITDISMFYSGLLTITGNATVQGSLIGDTKSCIYSINADTGDINYAQDLVEGTSILSMSLISGSQLLYGEIYDGNQYDPALYLLNPSAISEYSTTTDLGGNESIVMSYCLDNTLWYIALEHGNWGSSLETIHVYCLTLDKTHFGLWNDYGRYNPRPSPPLTISDTNYQQAESLMKKMDYDGTTYYLIENILIDLKYYKRSAPSDGIFVQTYFRHRIHIDHCILKNVVASDDWMAAIRLSTEDDAIISNCTLDHGYPYGLLLDDTNDIILSNNIIKDFDQGVYMHSSSDNIFQENSILLNTQSGIYIAEGSNRNQILGNDCNYNGKFGVYCTGNDNVIRNNDLCNNGKAGGYSAVFKPNTWENNECEGIGPRLSQPGPMIGIILSLVAVAISFIVVLRKVKKRKAK